MPNGVWLHSVWYCSETIMFLHEIFHQGLKARIANWPTLVLGELNEGEGQSCLAVHFSLLDRSGLIWWNTKKTFKKNNWRALSNVTESKFYKVLENLSIHSCVALHPGSPQRWSETQCPQDKSRISQLNIQLFLNNKVNWCATRFEQPGSLRRVRGESRWEKGVEGCRGGRAVRLNGNLANEDGRNVAPKAAVVVLPFFSKGVL